MPQHLDLAGITAMVERFNRRALDAGLSFRVESVDRESVYVTASFDFAYYINVDLQFDGLVFTSLRADARWPDVWHQDQLLQLSAADIEDFCTARGIDLPPDDTVHGFRFNRDDERAAAGSVVLCRSLRIDWRYPAHPD